MSSSTVASAPPTAMRVQLDWINTHRLTLVLFFALTLVMSFLRTRLDIYKSYEGVETTALSTWGCVELFVINFFFTLIFWFFITRLAPMSRDWYPFPLRPQDFALVAACAILLPTLLNMDIKFVQVVPGATELGVKDSTVFNIQDIYAAFVDPAEKSIFTEVDPEIDKKLEPVIASYGCEGGIAEFVRHVNRKILGAGYLTKEERDASMSAVSQIADDRVLSFTDKADGIAREAIKVFGLDYVTTTFDNRMCTAAP